MINPARIFAVNQGSEFIGILTNGTMVPIKFDSTGEASYGAQYEFKPVLPFFGGNLNDSAVVVGVVVETYFGGPQLFTISSNFEIVAGNHFNTYQNATD